MRTQIIRWVIYAQWWGFKLELKHHALVSIGIMTPNYWVVDYSAVTHEAKSFVERAEKSSRKGRICVVVEFLWRGHYGWLAV
jgi:hypothetical protein